METKNKSDCGYSKIKILCKCADEGVICPAARGAESIVESVGVCINFEDDKGWVARIKNKFSPYCKTIDDGIINALDQLLDALPRDKREAFIASRVKKDAE